MCLSNAERGPPGTVTDLGAGREQRDGVAHEGDRVVDVLEHLGADRVGRGRLLGVAGHRLEQVALVEVRRDAVARGDLLGPADPLGAVLDTEDGGLRVRGLQVDRELSLAGPDVEDHGTFGQLTEELEHHGVAVVVGRVALGRLAVLVPVVVPVVLVGPVGVEARPSAVVHRV